MGIQLLQATLLGEIASAFHSETEMKEVLAMVQLFNPLKEGSRCREGSIGLTFKSKDQKIAQHVVTRRQLEVKLRSEWSGEKHVQWVLWNFSRFLEGPAG